MEENRYARAASIWVARRFNLDENKVSDVDFAAYYGGYCETCGYETHGLDFKYNGKSRTEELGYYDITPGQFIEECVAILEEIK